MVAYRNVIYERCYIRENICLRASACRSRRRQRQPACRKLNTSGYGSLSASGDEKPDGFRNAYRMGKQMDHPAAGSHRAGIFNAVPAGRICVADSQRRLPNSSGSSSNCVSELHYSGKDAPMKERWGFLLCMHGTQLFSML